MGTNFYWAAVESPRATTITFADGEQLPIAIPDRGRHIGKRSAAGMYCYDCNRTLCPGGNAKVHSGNFYDPPWPEVCSKCGSKMVKTSTILPVWRTRVRWRLGLITRPRGVAGCCSFSWADEPEKVRRICEARGDAVSVIDEYDRTLTGLEFLAMLKANCPIEFRDSIGHAFS